MDQMVDIKLTNGKVLPAYFAPNYDTNPAIILIHEVWGLEDHFKAVADRLNKEGFNVLAPDLLTGTEVADSITPELIADMKDPVKRSQRQLQMRVLWAPMSSPEFSKDMLEKLQASYQYLRFQNSTRKIGVVGFCFGGTYGFQLAINQPNLAATVSYYGRADFDESDIQKIKSPILAFYGENDTALIDSLPQLIDKMKNAGKAFTYKIYPNSGHAFFNDTNPVTFNSEAATDAWHMTLEFLQQHLKYQE